MALRWWGWGAASLVLALAACSPPPPPAVSAGQTWMVASHRHDGATSVSILAIEPSTPLGPVAFVTVQNMALTLPDASKRSKLGPTAFTLPALQASLTDFQFRQGPNPRYEGYVAQWQAHAAEGRAVEFTYQVPVAEAMDAFEHGNTLPTELGLVR